MLKRREVSVEKLFQSDVSNQKCCKRNKCFAKANIGYLDAQEKRVSTMRTKERSYLKSMFQGNTDLFFSNGDPVC